MELSFRVLLAIILGLIVVIVIAGIMFNLSGQSTNVIEWVIDAIKKVTSLDFGTPRK